MKELKFDGMTELQDAEVMEVNGGNPYLIFVGGIIIGALVSELLDHDAQKDFQDGQNAARDFWS